jgi:aldose sugar dehydrogenase
MQHPLTAHRNHVVIALVLALLVLPLGATADAQVPAADAVPLPVGTVEVETLTREVTDPTSIEVAADGRVVIAERTGRVKVWHQDGTLNEAGRILTMGAACTDCGGENLPEEGGLHGILIAEDFLDSGDLWAYYSQRGSMGRDGMGLFVVSRFTLDPDTDVLDVEGGEVVLEIPTFFPETNHHAGDMEWLADGTILLSTGDNIAPFNSDGYSPVDGTEGQEHMDARNTSGNPADRRGKILRFNPDGTVPADNPHVVDPDYDPYVYAMGFRNPYRMSVHEASQTLILGNVGPDAFTASGNRGPAGYDEIEAVPPGGGTDHGWPFCIGDNEPYVEFDFATGESFEPFDCTGMTPAELWYPYGPSFDFPQVLAGLRAAMVGPVYDHDGDGALRLPAAFADRLLVADWARRLLFTIPVDGEGDLDTTQLVPFDLQGPQAVIDLEVGPDGAVYLAEYGGPGFYNNTNSAISRLKCLGCAPDPADYGGATVTTLVEARGPLTDGPQRAGVDPWTALLVVAALLALGIPLRRRVA